MVNNIISLKEIEKFVCSDFEIVELNGEKIIRESNKYLNIVMNWNPIKQNKENNDKSMTHDVTNSISNTQNINQNIILKNKILKLDQSIINLRSLGVEVNVNLLMAGESNFFIFVL